ncbi:zinc finger domain-containing protein [Mycobacterium persicum]|uniref:zinc finger domain-containing protein n=1 Tax=Mycobacterium persicum TaxID=1487726 RepID=UPI00115294E6|nr:hypothetical protein [Mycobacterium persicum]
MTTVEPHPALSYPCPFCGAEPSQPCRAHRGRGRELDWPHSRRIQVASPPTPPGPSKPPIRALCCECGNLRTVSANHFFRHDDKNRAQGGFAEDTRGWRSTGTLLCRNCGRPARHALLQAAGDRDYEEAYQQYALGSDWPYKWAPDRDRLRQLYFKQFPRNPNLTHWYLQSEAVKARAAGRPTMVAICGDSMATPPDHLDDKARSAEAGLVKPKTMRENEYEDAATGLSWVDMDCVNCLKVVNERRLQRARDDLDALIRWYSVRVELLAAVEVDELRNFLAKASDRTWRRWQKGHPQQALREISPPASLRRVRRPAVGH